MDDQVIDRRENHEVLQQSKCERLFGWPTWKVIRWSSIGLSDLVLLDTPLADIVAQGSGVYTTFHGNSCLPELYRIQLLGQCVILPTGRNLQLLACIPTSFHLLIWLLAQPIFGEWEQQISRGSRPWLPGILLISLPMSS